jgi:hypothetical protein
VYVQRAWALHDPLQLGPPSGQVCRRSPPAGAPHYEAML